jgi:hypothetical protein
VPEAPAQLTVEVIVVQEIATPAVQLVGGPVIEILVDPFTNIVFENAGTLSCQTRENFVPLTQVTVGDPFVTDTVPWNVTKV